MAIFQADSDPSLHFFSTKLIDAGRPKVYCQRTKQEFQQTLFQMSIDQKS